MALVPSTSVGGSGSGSGTVIDYVEYTAGTVAVTATSDATAQAYITGNTVAYTAVLTRVEVYVPLVDIRHTAAAAVVFNLYDGATDLGEIMQWENGTSVNVATGSGFVGVRYLTPTVATHTYSLKVWKTAGTVNVYGAAGGTAAILPAYIRTMLA